MAEAEGGTPPFSGNRALGVSVERTRSYPTRLARHVRFARLRFSLTRDPLLVYCVDPRCRASNFVSRSGSMPAHALCISFDITYQPQECPLGVIHFIHHQLTRLRTNITPLGGPCNPRRGLHLPQIPCPAEAAAAGAARRTCWSSRPGRSRWPAHSGLQAARPAAQ